MVDQILGHYGNAFGIADEGFECRPLGLELFLLRLRLALRDFFKLGVECGEFTFEQSEFGNAALVVDWHGCPIGHSLLDVVDADVVAKHRPRVGIGLFDRRAGEANEARAWECVPHVSC